MALEFFDLTNSPDNVTVKDADLTGKIARGLDGDDAIQGWLQDEYIEGDRGNDTIVGWGGLDTLVGGEGDDLIHAGFPNTPFPITSPLPDIFDDSPATLVGNQGNDVLVGSKGSDLILGDSGNDVLIGNDGNDTLYGGTGFDILIGGNGADYFVLKATVDLLSNKTLYTITDFDQTQDFIVFEGFSQLIDFPNSPAPPFSQVVTLGQQDNGVLISVADFGTLALVENTFAADLDGRFLKTFPLVE